MGGGTGLLLGVLASTEEGSFYQIGADDVVVAALVLGAVGAGVGALIGAVSHREEWEEVPRPVASTGPAE